MFFSANPMSHGNMLFKREDKVNRPQFAFKDKHNQVSGSFFSS